MNQKQIGHYTVIEKLGSGGMGDVYRARDSRLDRDVALKTLPELARGNADRLARFRREARLLAALAHPGIAPVFDVGESDGTHYLVMELVPGETLAGRLERGALPLSEALEIVRQVAGALAAAHEQGIVHRDLKPMNVMVRPDGRVSVVDFGLGKGPEAQADLSGARTVDAERTHEGAVLGTPGYMSPEQVRGEPAGPPTDVWALGCLLFEVLSGAKAYPGGTLLETAGAVLHTTPEWSRLPGSVPEPVRSVLAAALDKDPARRPGMREFRDRLGATGGSATAEPKGGWMTRLLGSFRRTAARAENETPEARGMARFVQVTFDEGLEEFPAWSPDGSEIVYSREVGRVRRLYVRHLESGATREVTTGDHDDIQPAWSPDGTRIAFVRGRTRGQKLEPGDVFGGYENADVWTLQVNSGHVSRIVDNAFNPGFSPDGMRLAVDASRGGPRRIWLMGIEGQNPTQLSSDNSEAVWHLRPRWSPDGRRIVFQNVERTRFDIRCVDVETRRQTWLTRDLFQDMHPVFSGTGDAVYFTSAYRGGGLNIWRVPVTASGEAGGPLRQITTGPGQDVELAMSPDGMRLCYSVHRQNAELWKLPVSPETGRVTGEPVKVVASSREDSRGAWSPDGARIAFNSNRTGDMNLWIRDLDDGSVRQVTRGPGGDYQPNWSPDQRFLAFFSGRSGNPAIWKLALDGGRPERLTSGANIDVNPAVSPDGSRIAYQSDASGRLEVWVMGADGSSPQQLTHVGCSGHFLCWSRDGRWVYSKSPGGPGSGVMRVPSAGGEPEALPAVQGGAHLSLSPDGTRIMDVLGHKALWVSPLEGEPEKVFEFPDADSRIDYPVWSPDGAAVLFDRFRPQGADIWIVEDFA